MTTDDVKDKPVILKFYDFSTGGTDVFDQRIGSYSVNTKSIRWTIAVFAYILDTSRLDVQTIYHMNKLNDSRKITYFDSGRYHAVF